MYAQSSTPYGALLTSSALSPNRRANRTFYTPGNHDVTLDPPPSWQPPRGKHLYWQLQTREYTRWKFKDMFGTPVYDLGWTADSISPPLASLSQSIVRPDATESQLGRYSTREEHTTRRAMHARVPINVTLPDGSGPTTVAELILLDTTDVVSLQRMGRNPYAPGEPPMGKPGAEADWRFGGAWWFLDSLAKTQDKAVPRILFTHVPLWRDPQDKTSCDLPLSSKEHPRRLPAGVTPVEPASIRRVSSAPRIVPGTNAEGTYENLVGKDWSRFILEKVQPSVIFTADDHDVCHHLHRNVSTSSSASSSSSFRVRNSTLDIPELTVPALSLTSGVKRPGFARLSMWQEQQQQRGQPSVRPQMRTEYLACELPPQLAMWALWYPLVVVVVGLILWLRSRRAAAAAAASRGRARGSAMAALAQSAKSALGKASSRGYRDQDNGGRDVESVPLTTLGKRSGEKGHDVDMDGSSEKESDESDSDTMSSGEASDVFEDTDDEERMVRSPETGELVFEYRDDDGSGDSSPPAYTQGGSIKNGKGKRKSSQGRSRSRGGGHGAAASGSSGSSGSGSGGGVGSRSHSRRASRASNNAIFVLDDEDGGGGDVEKAGGVASSSSSRLDDSKELPSTKTHQPSSRRRRRRGRRRLDPNDRFVTFAPWWSPTAWLIAPLRRKTRALVSRGRSGGRRGGHRGEGDGPEITPEIVAAPPPAFLVDLLVVAWPPTLFWILLWLLGL